MCVGVVLESASDSVDIRDAALTFDNGYLDGLYRGQHAGAMVCWSSGSKLPDAVSATANASPKKSHVCTWFVFGKHGQITHSPVATPLQ